MEKAENLGSALSVARRGYGRLRETVWREGDRDDKGVVLSVPASSIGCSNSLLRAEDPNQRLVGIELEDIVVVAMPDAVLVAHKSRSQDVKIAVNELRRAGVQAETLPRVIIAPGVGSKAWSSARAFR